MIKKKWVADNSTNLLADTLQKETNLNKNLIRILINRGIDTKDKINEFLNPSLDNLFDPYLLKDMDKATKRINEAIKNKETVCIYGDYDVDGVTASAILITYLRNKVGKIISYIPEREKEGYGLNLSAVEKIFNDGASLIITVDCGITSVIEAERIKELGMDLIVTDHHNCPETLPSCIAVINPKREGQEYPFSSLCGAGVAFKLVSALGEEDLTRYIAIAAIGTVADIVPLVSENRIIVYYGLKYLKNNKLKQITTLCDVAGVDIKDITTSTLGFVIAPRINAAGRMGSAKDALMLLLSEDEAIIRNKAILLNDINLKRQETEKEIYNQVKKTIEDNPEYTEKSIIVVAKEGWHEGVIGIVASKITEEYYKPCVLISMGETCGRGSLRSIKGFDIFKALSSVSEHLVKYGGHELAAGLTVSKENYSYFKKAIEDYADKIVKEGSFMPELFIDGELMADEFNEKFVGEISRLEPFGLSNPQPNFLIKDIDIINPVSFKENKHLRFTVKKENAYAEAVGFNMGVFAPALKENPDILAVGTVNINEYRGLRTFQIRIKDIKRKG